MNLGFTRRFQMGVLHSRWRGEGRTLEYWGIGETLIRVAFKIIAPNIKHDHSAYQFLQPT